LPGSSAGPNKGGARAPDGASALGSEVGAERDARRDLAQARAEGDSIPSAPPANAPAATLGFGQLNGAEQGISTPGSEKRDQMQTERNKEIHKQQPDLSKIAANSAGSASHNQVTEEGQKSTGARAAGDLLETVGRSTGTETGTGAARVGVIEVGRDASTARTA
ncbi:hypothetical protein, partial [Sporisorium scitamineum]